MNYSTNKCVGNDESASEIKLPNKFSRSQNNVVVPLISEILNFSFLRKLTIRVLCKGQTYFDTSRPIIICIHFNHLVNAGANVRHRRLAEQNLIHSKPIIFFPDPSDNTNCFRPIIENTKILKWVTALMLQLCFSKNVLVSDSILQFRFKRHALMLHDTAGLFANVRRSPGMRSSVQKFLASRSNNILTVSHSSKKMIRKIDVCQNIYVSYNGVSLPSAPKRERQMPGERKYTFIIITSGDKHKRDKLLLEKLVKIKSVRICVICNHPERIGIKSKRIDYFENASDDLKYQLLESSKIFITWSRIEGFGITVIEALYAGCFCAITDIPVFRELHSSRDNVIFLPKHELDQQKIEELTLMKTARKVVIEKKFQWSTIFKVLENTLNHKIGKGEY